MKIYVGRLSPEVSDDDLLKEFAAFGVVSSVEVLRENITGVSRGSGLVEMPSKREAVLAITHLHGRELRGRRIQVAEVLQRSRHDRGGKKPPNKKS